MVSLCFDPAEAKPEKTDEASAQTSDETETAGVPDAYNELKWYKKMADEGLITREQYEQKKKELLG